MPSVMVHKVSATLTDDAQYKDFNEIPTTALASGSVVELMPGTYDAIASANTAGVTLRGVGSPASVVIPTVTISSGTTGVSRFENLTIGSGTDTTPVVTVSGTSTTAGISMKGVVINTGAATSPAAIANHGTGAVVLRSCHFEDDDAIAPTAVSSVWSNGAGNVLEFCSVNSTSTNQALQGVAGTTTYRITGVYQTGAGGGNTGGVVTTVSSNIAAGSADA